MSSAPRTLSLHERYAVSRRCIGSASVISVAAILRLTASVQDAGQPFEALQRHLEARIDQALVAYPLLGYCVVNSRSKAPRWSAVLPTPTSKDVLHIGPTLGAQPHMKLLERSMLSEQASLVANTQLERGPLWKLVLQRVQGGSCLVVLSTDHVINDGRGTLNLFSLLLSSSPLPSPACDPIPPASDRLFDFAPSTSYMLGVVWQELVLPKLPLPRSIKVKLSGKVSWPASCPNDLVATPKDCAPALNVIVVSTPDLIAKLKNQARLHSEGGKPATIHAMLHHLALVALYAATTANGQQQVLGSCTPISLRDQPPATKRRSSTPTLPATTGNYVASYTENFRLSASSSFWHLINRFSLRLASRAGRSAAQQHMGLLAYIPDFESQPQNSNHDSVGKSPSSEIKFANGWEKFFATKTSSKQPFDSAINVSNLGPIHLSSPIPAYTLDSLTWSQSHTPQGDAFGLDVLSASPDSFSLALSSRPGAFKDAELHKTVGSFLQRLVVAFAKDDGKEGHEDKQRLDLSKDVTVGELTKFLVETQDT